MLVKRARECLKRLKATEEASGGIEEVTRLGDLHKELTKNSRPLHEVSTRAAAMQAAGIQLTLATTLSKHRQTVQQAATRLREKPESQTLKQGKRWPQLLEALTQTQQSLSESITSSWKSYVGSQLFTGPSPDELHRTLPSVPANQKALATYRDLYTELDRLRAVPPNSAQTVERLRELSEQLAVIQFQREVPKAVGAFLDAAKSPQGAPLSLLSKEVAEWLKSHELFDSYVIRGKVS